MHRLYRLLLHLYPTHHREEYGAEMLRVFGDRSRQEGSLRVAIEVFPDTIATAITEQFDTLRSDLRYALRGIFRKPAFAAVVIATFALGVGANIAVYSVVKGVLLDRLPYAAPDQLVQLWEKRPQQGRVRGVVSAPDYRDWKQQSTVFEDMAAMVGAAFVLPGPDAVQFIRGARVSATFFPMLGVQPILGRGFLAEEEIDGRDRVVLLSYGLWQRHFGGDRSVIGRKITLGSGEPFEIVGVLPDIRDGIKSEAEMWQPLTLRTDASRASHFLNVYARLKAGVTLAQARSEMDTIAARLQAQYPNENTGHGANVFALDEEIVGKVRPALLVLFGAVTLVLLVACANVLNLFLARAAQRVREVSVRAALGAGAGRLLRQLLTESIMLSLIAGSCGVVIAYAGVRALVSAAPEELPRLSNVRMDGEALLFALIVAVLSGIVFGMAPAMHIAQPKLAEALRQSSRNATNRNRLRKLLVVAEVALALVLVVGSGLLIRSFARLSGVHPGFDANNVLAIQVPMFGSSYEKPESRRTFMNQSTERLSRLPGVKLMGATNALPLTGNDAGYNFLIEGRPRVGYSQLPNGRFRVVTPAYFETMRIPLKTGRYFTEQDRETARPVVVINETMARTHWPDEDPIGRRITLAREKVFREIVGIVADVKHYGLDTETPPEMYFPFAQEPQSAMTIVLRTAVDPGALGGAVRSEIHAIDQAQPIVKMQTLKEALAASLAQPRLYSRLLTIFTFVALLLATVGLYGLMSFAVTQRTHEMGIRMALGARAEAVRSMIVREGLALTLSGVILGVAAALALRQVMAKLLYGIEATDTPTLVGSALLLISIGLAACYLPARRATRVDPMVTLRAE